MRNAIEENANGYEIRELFGVVQGSLTFFSKYIFNFPMSQNHADRSRTMFLIPAQGDVQEIIRTASFRKKSRNKVYGTKTCRNTDMHPFMVERNN